MEIAVTKIVITEDDSKVNPTGIVCQECGEFFKVKKSRLSKRKYCSKKCMGFAQSREQSGKMPKGFAKKEKYGPHCRLAFAKNCGHLTAKGRTYCANCRIKFHSEIKEKPCMMCGKIMSLSPSQYKKYKCCSFDCRNASISIRQSGDKSHLWRGGITDENRRLRNSAEYDAWRRAVFVRDGYACVVCGATGKLCADHIKEWSLYPALRFDIDNGRTLCFPCHMKTDNFGFKAYLKMKSMEIDGKLQYMLI